jgi:hypothetical protein
VKIVFHHQHGLTHGFHLLFQLFRFIERVGDFQRLQIVLDFLVRTGLADRRLDFVHLLFRQSNNVGQTIQIHLGAVQPAKGFLAPGLILRDPRGFFKKLPALLRLRRQNIFHPPLLNNGIAFFSNTRIEEEFLNIFQTALGFV